MATKKNKLTAKEALIMERLWSGPKTVRELLDSYEEPRPHFNTLSTLVRILVDKGFVRHQGVRNGAYVYEAIVPQDDMAQTSLTDVVRSYFNNSYFNAVSALVKEEKISVDELRELINMVEKGG